MRRYRERSTFGWRWCQGPGPAGCAAPCWRPGEMWGSGEQGSGFHKTRETHCGCLASSPRFHSLAVCLLPSKPTLGQIGEFSLT